MATDLVIDAKLNKEVYSLNNSGKLLDIDGWKPVSLRFDQTSTNFAAQLFVGPDGSYKIAYRGTANWSSGDVRINVGSIVLNQWTQELTDSVMFTHAAIRHIAETKGISYNEARTYLSLTGHSQGGFESEVNAKFFGLKGTSLDGPGGLAITQTESFTNLKNTLLADEPQLQVDYPIGEFVARRYTWIVGALNRHVDGVTTDNSIASLALSALVTSRNLVLGVGVQAQIIHDIDNIIDTETARANNRLWNILGQNETLDSTVDQIGGFLYPTYLANADGSVSLVTPDPVVMDQISGFLASQTDLNVSIYVRDGATYIEGSGGSLLIRSDGSGERWTTSSNAVTQEILGKGSIVTSRVDTQILDNQTITETSRYDSATESLVLQRRVVQTVNSDESVTREIFNGANELVVTSTAQQQTDGTFLFTDAYPDGREVTRVEDALLGFTNQPLNGAQTLYNAIKQGTFSDALSLLRAIQAGDPLPIVSSGLRFAVSLDSLDGQINNIGLYQASSFVSSTLSILNLMNALEEGDTLTAVTIGAQWASFGAQLYSDFAFNTALEAIDAGTLNLAAERAALDSQALATNISDALPYFNLVTSLESGDQIGIAAAVTDLALTQAGIYSVPYVGQVYAVYNIVSSLFGGDDDPPPEPWGGASAGWSGFSVVANSYGEHGGEGAVRSTMDGFINYLNQLAEYEQSVNPGSAIGVVANRLPSISYRHYSGFQLTDIDPLTGVQNYPGIKYDLTGHPYNAPAGTEQAGQSLSERFIRVALARGAVAPMWEVETAAIQTQYGDPKAGLTEEESAGRDGLLAGPLAGETQTFRPVALDLDGDGIETTGTTRSVAFDVDDSGFLKNTVWLGGDDGFLVLDRNLNGEIDSSKELFNNGTVALSARGLAGMRWVDSNYDGKLTDVDPVWEELKIWQDADGNGQVDAGEVNGLSALGITALDYAQGRFEQNGELKQLASPDLAADTEGVRTHVIPEGIVIETSGGQISLLATRIDDRAVLEANRDGVTGLEDIETIVSSTDLLANDMLGGFLGLDLTLAGVSNFTHGTGYLDGNGYVHFNPEANYNGPASFNYAIQAPTGQTDTATVDVNLLNTNDAPTATANPSWRLIYGWASYTADYDGNNIQPASPQYGPYYGWDYGAPFWWLSEGYHGSPVTIDTPSRSTGYVIPSDIDNPNGPFTYEILFAPQKGGVSVDANGHFEYINWDGPNHPGMDWPGGVTEGGETPTWRPSPEAPIELDPFTVRVTDPEGASTTITVNTYHSGGYSPNLGSSGGGGGGGKPIAIDLGNNGFTFTDVNDSSVFYDINGDGFRHRTAWPTADDGLLAYDLDGNGIIEKQGEISFTSYLPGAQTDLEGLKAFDTNNDGVLSSADEKWAKFGVWQDVDQDGITDAGEFQTLSELGVQSMALTSDGQFAVIDGQTVHGVGAITKTDGSTLNFADITLRYSNEVLVQNADGTTQVVMREPFSPSGEELTGTEGNDLILGKTGNNLVYAYGGDDVVFEDGGNDVIDGGTGDDTIYSGADNDIVMGGDGNDVVFAGLGNDLVIGGDGNDAILAESGNDVVFGGNGNDLVSGGYGNDVLSGDRGDDQVYGESGNDALFGMTGDDELVGMDGHDLLNGGDGNDLLDGGEGIDQMTGGTGDDTYVVDNVEDTITENPGEGTDTVRTSIDYTLGTNLENITLTGTENLNGTGNELDNILTGNVGANTLIGRAGNDTLDGGAGADALIGGTGDDLYVVDNAADMVEENADEGTDTVRASVSHTLSANVENLALTGLGDVDGSGNDLDNLIVGNRGANVLDGQEGADTMMGGRGDDTYIVDSAVDTVMENLGEGSDTVRSSISYALGANLENLTLTGTADLDGTGNELGNVLAGNDGNNVLAGGQGDDALIGWAGDDTYSYVLGDGSDTILDTAGADTLALAGVALADLNTSMSDNDLVLELPDGNNITIQNWFLDPTYHVETVSLDGTAYNASFIEAWGHAPVLAAPVPDMDTDEDSLFSLDISAYFTDVDLFRGDILSYSAVLTSGSGLPAWLSFDANTGTFTGIPLQTDVGSLDIQLTATDSMGRSASEAFTLTVNNVNDVPIVANSIIDQTTDEDSQFSFTLPTGTFADEDSVVGDTLTLSAALVDGTKLPTWLTFDAATGTFTGTPDNWQVGSYDIRVTATDLADTGASDVFSLTVNNVNDNPVLANALGDLATDEDAPFSFTAPAGTFDDDDFIHGDSLTLSAALWDGSVLPDWLTFDATTGTFSGTPDNWDVSSYDIRVTATDTGGLSVSDVFTLTVNNVNDAPVVANAIPDQLATEGAAFSYAVAGDTFHDDDTIHGDTLSYTAILADGSDLPSWLSFDANTQTFTGTAPVDSTLTGTDGDDILVDSDTGISGAWDIRVSATDTSGVSADDTFTLTLQGIAGNDTLNGGKGNDVLNGGGGDDTYLYNVGDGLDTLTDYAGQDTVAFGTGFSFENTVIRTEGGVARLRFLDDCGCETEEGLDITLNPDGSSPIETFAFTDGSSYTLADLTIQQKIWYGTNKANTIITGRHDDTIYAGKGGDVVYSGTGNDTVYGEKGNDKLYGEGGNDALYGDKGDDYLNGGCGNDILDGGKGHNTLIGEEGNDTLILAGDSESNILFNLGDGWDTLKTAIKDEGHDSDIHFGSGITQENLWFTRNGDNLLINILGTQDGMTLEGWYTSKHRPIEEIETANGYELEDKQVELLVQAMAAFSPIPGSGNVLPAEMPDSLQPVLAAAWESHG